MYRLLLLGDLKRVERGYETGEMVGTLEGFVGEAFDLSLHFAGGGSEICVWR